MTAPSTSALRVSPISSGKPPLREEEDPFLTLYRHNVPCGPVLVRRVVVARDAELITAFCRSCARDLETHQVLCFQRTLAVGETVALANGMDRTKGDTT